MARIATASGSVSAASALLTVTGRGRSMPAGTATDSAYPPWRPMPGPQSMPLPHRLG